MNECIINFGAFNWWAILVATLAGYALGALWYSPLLFGKAWMKLENLKEDDLKKGWFKAMFITLITTFLTAFALEAIVATWGINGWNYAIPLTFLLGLFLYAGNVLSDFLYARKPMKLFLITAMYRVVMIFVIFVILIIWK